MEQSVSSCSIDLEFSEGSDVRSLKTRLVLSSWKQTKMKLAVLFSFSFTFGIDRGEDGGPKHAGEGSTRSERRGILPSCFLRDRESERVRVRVRERERELERHSCIFLS